MEACPGSQWLARTIRSFGHAVRIIPAQFVKPYLKLNKNDTLDAEAIAEPVTRPTMRFVEIKSVDQVDIQALHRARDMMVMQRNRTLRGPEAPRRSDCGTHREIEALVVRDDVARRLLTVPGIGAMGTSAILVAVGQGRQFKRARDLAA